jgi:hypothetical protein
MASIAITDVLRSMSSAQLLHWAEDVYKIKLSATDRQSRLTECLALAGSKQAAPAQQVMLVQTRCKGVCQTRVRAGYCHGRKWATLDPQPTTDQLAAIASDRYLEIRSV